MRTIELRPDVDNATLEQLQQAMEAAPNKRSYIRLANMRSLLRGMSRQDVSDTFCRSDRMVRLWIIKYAASTPSSASLLAGESAKSACNAWSRCWSPCSKDPAQAAMEHWTGVKAHGWAAASGRAELQHRRALSPQLELPPACARPWPRPLLDEPEREQQRQAFHEQIAKLAADPAVELWFGDECGVDGRSQAPPTLGTAGSKPKVPHLGKHLRRSVVGGGLPAWRRVFQPHVQRGR